MCGIVAYCGPERRSLPQELVRLLASLEYRGYDSAGVASAGASGLTVVKAIGTVGRLAEKLRPMRVPAAEAGVAHTRWATHGAVTEANTHPLVSAGGKYALAMNGVVENDEDVQRSLGMSTESDTATVLALVTSLGGDLREALARIDGRVSLVLLSRDNPDVLVLARRGSLLFLGRAGRSLWVASDPVAFPPPVDAVFELKDGETIAITSGQLTPADLRKLSPVPQPRRRNDTSRGAHASYLEKEILEQETGVSAAVEAALAANVLVGGPWNRVVLLGCGSAYHACLGAKHAFERWARIPTEAALANELMTSDPVIDEQTLAIAVSQSGETADTIAAATRIAAAGATLIAVTNAPGSSLARMARTSCGLGVGTEVSVASTKAYTAMVVRLGFLAAELGVMRKTLSASEFREIAAEARTMARSIGEVLGCRATIATAAARWAARPGFLFVGRGLDHATALEGALKLKELSYRHAEGLAAGELKHGTLALIDDGYPVVAIALDPRSRAKMSAAVREVRTRGADVLVIGPHGDVASPGEPGPWAGVLGAIPLQWLALELATMLARDLDKPRNLAKSVTVV